MGSLCSIYKKLSEDTSSNNFDSEISVDLQTNSVLKHWVLLHKEDNENTSSKQRNCGPLANFYKQGIASVQT